MWHFVQYLKTTFRSLTGVFQTISTRRKKESAKTKTEKFLEDFRLIDCMTRLLFSSLKLYTVWV